MQFALKGSGIACAVSFYTIDNTMRCLVLAVVVCFTLCHGYDAHYSSDKYDLSSYRGLFFTKDELKDMKEDMDSLMLATIKDKDRSFRFQPGHSNSRDAPSRNRRDKDAEQCPERTKKRTCQSCCETQWVADRVWKVSYNNTDYNVVQTRNNYQVVFQGICLCKNCGPVITCGEENSFFTQILVEDNKAPRDGAPPTMRFLPLRISRYCQCSRGAWIV